MKYFAIIAAVLSATSATAGGFEASRLDTKFMYEKGNYAEMSHAALVYDIQGKNITDTGTPDTYKMEDSAKNQKRSAFSFKTDVGDFAIGFSSFKSGAIQLDGSARAFGATGYGFGNSPVPETDVEMQTQMLMGKYSVSENLNALVGINRNTLKDSEVITSRGKYIISGNANTGSVFGLTYSKPEIALRVELLAQPKASMNAATNFTASTYGKGAIGVARGAGACTTGNASDYYTASFNSTLSRPDTVTLNVQSGIAKDTLAFGSVHRTTWGSSQIDVPTGCVATAVSSKFWDTTTYSLGLARKMSEKIAVTAEVSKETGGPETSTSLFSVNSGYTGIKLGARYTLGKLTLSGGYSYARLGNIVILADATNPTREHAKYTNNSVSGFGLKIGINF